MARLLLLLNHSARLVLLLLLGRTHTEIQAQVAHSYDSSIFMLKAASLYPTLGLHVTPIQIVAIAAG